MGSHFGLGPMFLEGFRLEKKYQKDFGKSAFLQNQRTPSGWCRKADRVGPIGLKLQNRVKIFHKFIDFLL